MKSVYNCGNFKRCLTHNAAGEYGNITHCKVHNAVNDYIDCQIYVPVTADRIGLFPINEEIIEEKKYIFNNFYVTETFVLEEYKNGSIMSS